LHTPEQQSEPVEQMLPLSPHWTVTHIWLVQLVIPVGEEQQSEVAVQLCPDVLQVEAHWLLVQMLEQQSVFPEQLIPKPAQAPAGPHTLLLQMAEQHCEADVHAVPLLRQVEPVVQ
jgi:hypothetical protein